MSKSNKKPIESSKPRADNNFQTPASLTCACDRNLTLAELGRTFSAQKKERLENFLPHLNAVFQNYQIRTCIRKAHFLAQVGHETGELSFLAETLPKGTEEKDVYDGYKGRGLIQITYKDGYMAYGSHVGQDFTGAKRVKLEEAEWATDSAGWYWTIKTSPSLNDLADKNDIIYITQAINGAFNGYDDRVSILRRATSALMVETCPARKYCPNFFRFSFESSAANDIPAAAFAWGLWHDSISDKRGVVKSDAEALLGYRRFLELKPQQNRGRFGFKNSASMLAHAEKRAHALSGERE